VIVELIVQAVAGLVVFIVGLFPTVPPAGWLTNGITDAVAMVGPHLAGFGAWVPFTAAGQAVGFVVAALAVAVLVKLVRIVASFFTAGGGSAA
jgi:hypothetical protein